MMEDRHMQLERPAMRIWNLFLGPPPGQARLADHLDEAIGQLRVELATQRDADLELEALWTSAVRVQDLVLGSVDGPSSQTTSMSTTVELLEGRIDAACTNGVCWGSRFVLVATMSHFLELKTEMEVLGSRHSMDMTED
jgi:hypothetical protein